MNVIARYLALLVGTLSLGAFASDGDIDPTQEFRSTIEASFIEEFRDEIVSELIESGVAESDAEETFSAFVSETVSCVLAATRTAIERRGQDPDEVLSNIEMEDVYELYRDEAEFFELNELCVLIAIGNAGLQP